MLLITMGNMLRGKRRMLNSARETNAFWASSTLFSSESTYTAKVDRATYRERRNQGHFLERCLQYGHGVKNANASCFGSFQEVSTHINMDREHTTPTLVPFALCVV